MTTATDRPVVYVATIHLADDEWGNEKMAEVARDYFDANPSVGSRMTHAMSGRIE